MATHYRSELPYQKDISLVYQCIRDILSPILLDSSNFAGNEGRYDILSGAPEHEVISSSLPSQDSTSLETLNNLLREYAEKSSQAEDLPFSGGLIGYIAYDFNQNIEKLPPPKGQDISIPNLHFLLVGWAIITDHTEKKTCLVAQSWVNVTLVKDIETALTQPPKPLTSSEFTLKEEFSSNISEQDYLKNITRIKSYIANGDCYQVNYAQRFSANCDGDPWQAYLRLRASTKSPYSAYFEARGGTIMCTSPERFFISNKHGEIETNPIKGTRPRNAHPQQDTALAKELINSPKDKAENLMIVDLLRNDLSKVCLTNSVKAPELFKLHSFSNVHHLVSRVTGLLQSKKTPIDVLQATFPGGSITGAPKVRSMEIINELEPNQRSIYCGSIGYIGFDHQSQFNICIRTMLHTNNKVYCWGGGGIVSDSIPEQEYQESLDKIQLLMETLEQ